MKILRLSTLSLTLAAAVFALGYNSSFADPKNCGGQHCNHGDDPGGFPTGMTVQLIGGAFVFNEGEVGVTPDSEVKLNGDVDVNMTRPDFDPALQSWNNVFDLCGLLGPSGMVEVAGFPVSAGRKGWTVQKVLEEVWVGLQFPLVSPLLSSDPLFTDRLTAGMQLIGACLDTECSLIPDDTENVVDSNESTLTILLTKYAIHLRAKGGVTHEALCHAGDGLIGVDTTLVITRPL